MESTNKALSREELLAPRTLKREVIEVPELGGTVIVSELSATERDAFEASCIKRKGKKTEPDLVNLRAKLLAQALRDATGARLFADTDVPAIGQWPASAANPLFEVAMRLSGLNEGDVEELAGN